MTTPEILWDQDGVPVQVRADLAVTPVGVLRILLANDYCRDLLWELIEDEAYRGCEMCEGFGSVVINDREEYCDDCDGDGAIVTPRLSTWRAIVERIEPTYMVEFAYSTAPDPEWFDADFPWMPAEPHSPGAVPYWATGIAI